MFCNLEHNSKYKKKQQLNTVILKLKECLKAEKNGISLSQKGTILLWLTTYVHSGCCWFSWEKKLLLEDVENCFEYLCYQTTPHNIRKLSITEPLPILKSHSWVSTECFSLHFTSTVAWSKQCWEQSICAELSITNSYQTFSEADPSLLQIYLAWRHSSTSSRECSLTHASAAAAGWMRGKITQNTALSAR